MFNDCAHPQKFQFAGVVGDCFCPSTTCEIYDSNNAPQCVDANGATCFPVDNVDNADPSSAVPDGLADDCAESTTAITINAQVYNSVEVECYCPEETCVYDWNGDAVSRCYSPSGATCDASASNNRYVDWHLIRRVWRVSFLIVL